MIETTEPELFPERSGKWGWLSSLASISPDRVSGNTAFVENIFLTQNSVHHATIHFDVVLKATVSLSYHQVGDPESFNKTSSRNVPRTCPRTHEKHGVYFINR